METIEAAIQDVLPTIQSDLLKAVAEKLLSSGVESKDDLQYVEESDLKDLLRPIQCRKLLNAWKAREPKSNNEEEVVQLGSMADDRTIEMPTLGRHMQLGTLYDCRRERFIPGITLWDDDALQNNRHVHSKNETQLDIISNDDFETKSTALGVESSLKASYVGGLVEVEGSGKYLNDRKTSNRQTRLVLQYKTKTTFEELLISQLGQNVQCTDVFEEGLATHVVTGVSYGAQAFFVFDRYLDTNEDVKDIEEQMKLMIEKIRSMPFQEEGELDTGNKEQKDTADIECTFYGDFRLEDKPTNYNEAVNIYKQLPTLLGKDGEHAVPMTVWLYPLRKLDSVAAKLVREVSIDLISNTLDIMEELNQREVRANDMKDNAICKDFPKFIEKLELFKEHISHFRLAFQQRLAEFLPKFRGGADEEQTFADLLAEYKQSPFCMDKVDLWLKNKEKEMNVVKAYMKGFAQMRIIRSRDDLVELVFNPDIPNLVCFSFPLIGYSDEYLESMSQYIKTPSASEGTYPKLWFEDASMSGKIRIRANQFRDFARVNHASKDTTFTVMGLDDGDEKATNGGTIFLYQHGVLITKDYEPPEAPGIPIVSKTTHDTACIEWDPPKAGESTAESYIVKYRDTTSGDQEWKEVKTESKIVETTIRGLVSNALYEFSVAAVCRIGVSEYSSTSKTSSTLPASPPSRLRKSDVCRTSITVTWDKPISTGKDTSVEKYQIKYCALRDQSQVTEIEENGCSTVIGNLNPGSTYRISVCALCQPGGKTRFSDPIDVSTKSESSAVQQLKEQSQLVIDAKASEDELPTYKVPLSLADSLTGNVYRMYEFGKARLKATEHRVIMIVGATGAGKSTLINGMMNYILRVAWKDPFRFKIIAEQGENTSGTQAESQTQYITSYTIHQDEKQMLKYTLTIIDTPGFGDTRGIDQDKLIIDQIQSFFSNSTQHRIDHINAIGFVAQSSQSRLTHTQKYVFDSILSVFGKDIADNIMLLITFADGKKPPVMDAIKAANIPCTNNVFKFNNSALFANNAKNSSSGMNGPESSQNKEDDDDFDKMFWRMNLKSMEEFFFALNKVEEKSLSLTREVLQERKNLETSVASLQEQIKIGCCKLEELRREQLILEENEAKIQANKDFTYPIEVPKSRKIDITGEYITNCSKCHFSCHYPCYIADDREKYHCAAMDWWGKAKSEVKCKACPGKCIWDVHFNQGYRFDFYTETEIRKYSDLEKKYNEAKGGKLSVEKVIEAHLEEFHEVQECVIDLISESHNSILRLEEIALKPNPLSVVEYVDLLIQTEEQELKFGWKDRVTALYDVRKNAEILGKVREKGFDPFQGHRAVLKSLPMKREKKNISFLTRVYNYIKGDSEKKTKGSK